jgi:hypothetical protein
MIRHLPVHPAVSGALPFKRRKGRSGLFREIAVPDLRSVVERRAASDSYF